MSWNFDNLAGADGGSPGQSGNVPASQGGVSPDPVWTGATASSPWSPDASSQWIPETTEAKPPGTGNGGFEWPDQMADEPGLEPAFAVLPTGKPPALWFAGAAASAGLALLGATCAAIVLHRALPLALASWLLAGPVAVLLIGQFVKLDERQRARPFYEGGWARPASFAVGVVILIAVTISAYVIADWAATR